MAQRTSQWFLIAGDGDKVVRVRPGMTLGETAAGDVTFDPAWAQLELDIADDGGLVLRAVQNHELESQGGARGHHERLAPHHGAKIRLAHNVVRLDTDFSNPALADDTVALRAVQPEDVGAAALGRRQQEPTGGAGDTVAAAPRRDPSRASRHADDSASDDLTLEEKLEILLPRLAPRPPRPGEPMVNPAAISPPQTSTGHRRQILTGVLAAMILVIGAGIVLLYPTLDQRGPLNPAASADPVGTRPAQATPAPAAGTGSAPEANAVPAAAGSASSPASRPARDVPPATEPASREQVAERPAELSPEPEPEAAPVIEPIMLPPVPRRSMPPVSRTAAADGTATPATTTATAERAADTTGTSASATTAAPRAGATPVQPAASEPDPALLAELDEIGASAEALAAELTRRRDLLAANLAQRYINRALAQLAGNALDDARTSLQAAANAGADPRLVDDLQREVEYRRWLVNARQGRFETPYPIEQLVAVNQEPPRVPGGAFTGGPLSLEVQFTVTARGDVRDVVVSGAPPDNLERALRQAVRGWRFEPVVYEGRRVPVRSSVRFTFGA